MMKTWQNLQRRLMASSVKDRISGVAAMFAVLIALLMSGALYSFQEQRVLTLLLGNANSSNRQIERTNALIYAVVMESRGIYMSADRTAARRYAEALMQKCSELVKAVDDWQQLVRSEDAEMFAQFKRRIDQFVAFRQEMARRTLTIGSTAARELGDNDENRAVRTALNEDLEQLSRVYEQRSREIAAMVSRSRWLSLTLFGFGAVLMGFTGVAAFLLHRTVVNPLLEIARTTGRIAGGRIKLVIPHAKRDDEIGQVARAVQAYQDAASRVSELEQHGLDVGREQAEFVQQREQLEERALTGKWRLEAALKNMAQGLIMIDRNGTVLVVNEQYRNIYGVPASIAKPGATMRDILSHRVKSGVFTGDVEQYLADLMSRIQARRPCITEVELADDHVIRISERPMDGGGWVATHEDFTVHRRNERMLARAEYFLAALLENIPQAVVAKDAQSLRYVFANRATEALFGLPRSAIIGRAARELFPEPTGTLLESSDRDQLVGDADQGPQAHSIETPGNGKRDIVVRRLTVSIGENQPKFLLSIIEDRTPAHRAAA
ncbi:PAS domain S-box-containing protein [Bradyrhizobium sp. USDA 4369]